MLGVVYCPLDVSVVVVHVLFVCVSGDTEFLTASL